MAFQSLLGSGQSYLPVGLQAMYKCGHQGKITPTMPLPKNGAGIKVDFPVTTVLIDLDPGSPHPEKSLQTGT
jgi:hypothetical protein